MKKFLRGPGAYVFILLVVLFITTFISSPTPKSETIDYTDFMAKIESGDIVAIEITDNNAKALRKNSSYEQNFPSEYDYDAYIPSIEAFTTKIESLGKKNSDIAQLPITYKPKPEPNWFISSLPYLLVSLLMIGFFWYMLNQQGQGGSKVMSFGKSRARVNTDDKNKKTFEDVAGADEEKEELQEIVDFLKNPRKFSDLGARIPKGVLLVGPPGTGKTLLAKAVAGEAGVPFYSISGSDFVEMFVGVGASRVRDLFETAKKNTPSMVFIDEIDAVGRHRGAGLGGGHDEREQTLNQLLVEMDGFAPNEGIIIIAATNRPDILDPALLRPGRFDRQITVNYPDAKGREEILKVHARGKPIGPDVDLKIIAKRTPWQTGADLENILNEAAILTARRNKQNIGMQEVLEAINRVEIGPEKKSSVVTEKDKKLVSYHETGHAVVAHMLEHCDPVHEVSIIPRGQAGGYTQTLPGEETRYMTRGKLLDRITMSMGGRAAEQLMIGEISTGATSDLKMASQTAKAMVVEYGMSEAIGNIYYGGDQEVFLGRDYGHAQAYSEEVAAKIDQEVKRILDNSYRQAVEILDANRGKMELVVKVLLEREKIDGDEFIEIVGPSPYEKNYEVMDEIKRATTKLGLSDSAEGDDDIY